VVAGHHQRRRREPVDELPRLAELLGLGALREVARERDDVRAPARRELLDLLGQLGQVGRAEVYVRDVQQVAQRQPPRRLSRR